MSDGLAVLSIEDSEDDFLFIERELKRAGLLGHCLRVDDKDALLAALADRHWDVVLSDYSVPGMYFTEVLGHFKRHWPDLPVILVSGTIGDVKAAAMVKLGARDFVSKDRLSELAAAIRRHVKQQATS